MIFKTNANRKRQQFIIDAFMNAFDQMIETDPAAWQKKFRKMSVTPYDFYKDSTVVSFTDLAKERDKSFLNEQTSKVWIHRDLHASNFGTQVREDYNLFVDAFRNHKFPGL